MLGAIQKCAKFVSKSPQDLKFVDFARLSERGKIAIPI
jgi:hypothetical protein